MPKYSLPLWSAASDGEERVRSEARATSGPSPSRSRPRFAVEGSLASPPKRSEIQTRAGRLEGLHETKDCTLRRFTGHRFAVLDVYVSNGFVYSAGKDRAVRKFDLATAECVATFSGHTGAVTALHGAEASSPVNTEPYELVVTSSLDGTAKLWDAKIGQCMRTYSGHTAAVSGVRLHLGSVYTSSLDGTLHRYTLQGEAPVKKYMGHIGEVWCLALQQQFLFSGSEDTTARQWHITTAECIRVFKGHHSPILSLCTFGGGQEERGNEHLDAYLVTGSEQGNIRLWRADEDNEANACVALTAGEYAQLHGSADILAGNRGSSSPGSKGAAILAIVASEDGSLFSASEAGIICEFDLNNSDWAQLPPGTCAPQDESLLWLRRTRTLSQSSGAVYGLAVSGMYLFAASADCAVHEYWRESQGLRMPAALPGLLNAKKLEGRQLDRTRGAATAPLALPDMSALLADREAPREPLPESATTMHPARQRFAQRCKDNKSKEAAEVEKLLRTPEGGDAEPAKSIGRANRDFAARKLVVARYTRKTWFSKNNEDPLGAFGN